MSNNDGNKTGCLVVAGGLLFAVAVAAAIGFQYYKGQTGVGDAANGPGDAPAAVAASTTVTAFVGGEKIAFLKDPRVVALLKDKYGLTVDAAKSGSLEMVAMAAPGKDALWPSSASAVDIFKERGGSWVAKENIFSSPLVIDAYDTVATALTTAGLIKERNGAKYLDLAGLVTAMDSGKTWKDYGMPAGGRIKIFCTDPTKSNSGLMFAGLLSAVLNKGEPPDEASVDAVLPPLKEYFGRLGAMDASSADLFGKFLSMGAGAYPMVAAYENQLVEFVDSNPQYREQIEQHVVVLYPEPTTWSEHPVLALNANGKRLLDALQDEELKKIASEGHGFRSALSGVTGKAVAVDATVPMPGEAVTRRIVAALGGG